VGDPLLKMTVERILSSSLRHLEGSSLMSHFLQDHLKKIQILRAAIKRYSYIYFYRPRVIYLELASQILDA
jgi:hypothetical protein